MRIETVRRDRAGAAADSGDTTRRTWPPVTAATRSSSGRLTSTDIFPVPPAAIPRARGPARASTRDPVLDVRDLVKHFPLMKGGMLRRRVGTVHAVDGISFDIRERRDARAGRRVGLRQDDDHHGDPESRETAGRHDRRARARHGDADARRALCHPARSAGRVPGSDGVARPAPADRRHPRRAARDARRAAGRSRPPRARAAAAGRPAAGARQPVSAGVLRRTAAAHRHRARARARAEGARARRAGIGARRVDPRRHHQPARSSCRPRSACRTSSSPTTCRWFAISPTASP